MFNMHTFKNIKTFDCVRFIEEPFYMSCWTLKNACFIKYFSKNVSHNIKTWELSLTQAHVCLMFHSWVCSSNTPLAYSTNANFKIIYITFLNFCKLHLQNNHSQKCSFKTFSTTERNVGPILLLMTVCCHKCSFISILWSVKTSNVPMITCILSVSTLSSII